MRGDQPGGPIRWKLHLPVPPEMVFETLNTDDGRESFWAESAKERDGEVHFEFINGMSCRGRILERRSPFVFAVDYFGGEARFNMAPDGQGGTDLMLTHHDVAVDAWQEVHAGWLNVLFPLKAFIAFGVDLRTHDASRSWEDGYVDQ